VFLFLPAFRVILSEAKDLAAAIGAAATSS
jgi:hypothetical protein